MSTTGYSDWAADLAEVGAVYPFQGWELFMTIVCIVFWLGWHRVQFKAESHELQDAASKADANGSKAAIDRY